MEYEKEKGMAMGTSAAAENLESMLIPLGDVMSVDEEVSSRRARQGMGNDTVIEVS